MAFTTKFTDIDLTDEMLDADALQILSSATAFVGKILQARKALDNAGQKDKPLFVVIGEQHDLPAHRLHALSVLDQLRNNGEEVAWADELPYNELAANFFASFDVPYDDEIASTIMAHDQEEKGAISVIGDLCTSIKLWADHSDKLLMMYLVKNAVHTAFTDAAQSKYYITPPEARTSVSAQQCFGRVPPLLAVHSADGMHLRNHMMVAGMRDLAKQSGARIVIQRCGGKHLIGHADSELPYDQSLMGLLHAQEQPAMGFAVKGEVVEGAPSDAPYGLAGFVTTSDLPDWAAHKAIREDGSQATPIKGHFRHSSDEESYSSHVMKKLGLGAYYYTYAALSEEQSGFLDVLAEHCEGWGRDHYEVVDSPKP